MQNLATESITIHVTDGLSREEASYVVEQDFPDGEILESLARPSRPAITRTDSLAATPSSRSSMIALVANPAAVLASPPEFRVGLFGSGFS